MSYTLIYSLFSGKLISEDVMRRASFFFIYFSFLFLFSIAFIGMLVFLNFFYIFIRYLLLNINNLYLVIIKKLFLFNNRILCGISIIK